MTGPRPAIGRPAIARLVIGCLLAGALLGACGRDAVPPEPPQPTLSADLSFSCAGVAFPAAALAAPTGAEQAETPAAAALRRHVRSGALAAEDLPLTGYRVLSASDDRVVFATDVPSAGLVALVATRASGVWSVTRRGVCEPRLVLPPGLNAATWRLPTGAAPPGPDAASFTAMVAETSCANGQSAEGRILPPVVIREPTRVLVIFAVRPPVRSGLVTCPAPPPTAYEVRIGGPLGARELLDGGVFPPADVVSPECCG